MNVLKKRQLIQVNLNRFKEGARVLEDVARFVLEEFQLFKKAKQLKQSVDRYVEYVPSIKDMGDERFSEEQSRKSLRELIVANAHRMQESARVLEELSDRMFFKALRFRCYSLQQDILQCIYPFSEKLSGIYPIFDPRQYTWRQLERFIEMNDCSICQLRMKGASKQEVYSAATRLKEQLDCLLIINDHVDIALMCADGVHLGQNDLSVESVRGISKFDFIVGVSCHNLVEALSAQKSGASYISVGCLFESKTKPDAVRTNLDMLNNIAVSVDIPVCAIGGVGFEKMVQLEKLGADMFAMSAPIGLI